MLMKWELNKTGQVQSTSKEKRLKKHGTENGSEDDD